MQWTRRKKKVIQLLKDQNKGSQFLKDPYVAEFEFRPDIYAPNGIESLGLKGETIIEIKRFLSYSNYDRIKYFYKETGKRLNLLVVYLDTSLSDIVNIKGQGDYKSLIFISLSYLENGLSDKKEEDE